MITMKTRKNATRLAALIAAILLPLSPAACGWRATRPPPPAAPRRLR